MPDMVSMSALGDQHEVYLGTCCICEATEGVLTVVQLDAKCPMRGRGWGCAVCRLPADGAQAVLCDACAERYPEDGPGLVFVCTGYPGSDGRTPASKVRGSHKHDLVAHLGDDMGER